MGLNDIYENVRSQLLHREKLPSLEEAIGAIRQPKSCLRVSSEPQGHNSDALLTKKPEIRATSTGNWTSRPSPPSSIQGVEGDDYKDLLFCTYCKKHHHTKENFLKLAWKNQNTGKKAYATSCQPRSTQVAVTSPAIEQVQQKLSSTALVKLGNSLPHQWIADTGATDHMSPSVDCS